MLLEEEEKKAFPLGFIQRELTSDFTWNYLKGKRTTWPEALLARGVDVFHVPPLVHKRTLF